MMFFGSTLRFITVATFTLSSFWHGEALPLDAQLIQDLVFKKPTLIPLKKISVPVRGQNDEIISYKQSFAGDLSLGLPVDVQHQAFSVIFDTGSGQVIVPDNRCTSEACLVHRTYDVTKSSTGYPINSDSSRAATKRDTVDIRFGSGLVSGQFARENVCVGSDSEHSSRRCVEMGIVTATTLSDVPFLELDFDGIVGLGLSGLSVTKEFSFLGRLVEAKSGRTQFGIYLAPTDEERGHELALAGHNPARFKGALHWTPVVQPERGFWLVMIKGIRIGNESLDVCGQTGCQAIVDTGSSHMGVPRSWTNQLIDMLSGDIEGQSDCRHTHTPDLHIDFEDFSLSVRAREYMRKLPTARHVAEGEDPLLTCRPKLKPVSIPKSFGTGDFFILGEPVFNRYYTVFDFGERSKIGFGAAKHPGDDDVEGIHDAVQMFQVTLSITSTPISPAMQLNVVKMDVDFWVEPPPGVTMMDSLA